MTTLPVTVDVTRSLSFTVDVARSLSLSVDMAASLPFGFDFETFVFATANSGQPIGLLLALTYA